MECIKTYKQEQTLAMRLPSYKPLSLLIRFASISLVAIGILNLIAYVLEPQNVNNESIPLKYYLIMIISFNVSGEFQIVLDNILERILPIPKKIRLRMGIQVISTFVLLAVAIKIVMLIIEPDIVDEQSRAGVFMGVISGLFFVHIMANALTIARFTSKWIDFQNQMDKIKQEKLKMDYNSLQDQLNPHFLFNNLSVLKSLIIYDKESAVEFTENFTDVYRYVLQSKEKRLVEFKEEGNFLESYIALHKERLGEGLIVQVSIDRKAIDMKIAPLTMQLLVENAIKHNIASTESPLHIKVYTEDDYLTVENNIQRRTTSYSTKTGLNNLIKRYEILTEKEIQIEAEKDRFVVRIPLL